MAERGSVTRSNVRSSGHARGQIITPAGVVTMLRFIEPRSVNGAGWDGLYNFIVFLDEARLALIAGVLTQRGWGGEAPNSNLQAPKKLQAAGPQGAGWFFLRVP